MNLKQLEYFVCIAEAGSINKAARSLRIAQSALTRQMQLLEEGLGAPLMSRSPRGICLTRQGHCLLEYGRRILLLVSRAEIEIARHPSPAMPPAPAPRSGLPRPCSAGTGRPAGRRQDAAPFDRGAA
jgi:DNA-binding transcriptional LysR family regulator